ncbi:ATP-dependent helicase HrpB [Pseudovibrio exalbescens]|uniref:ATP-dependent helicase HrpB n=1 Tax=Pseudovibrio exalbescens TaxID=197461 RepID=UPI0023664E76|nr:ATP-dependent helicase HrpB [Pseudovibrio exalbescens]MDD7910049.1 ATP-dependent helicase HrpB [Pseudovibrio exalbescens]
MSASDLPIDEILPELLQHLERTANAVVVAEPGAGKTTRIPLALLDAPWRGDGKIIVLEPRRLAARAAARRMAETLGEKPGETVGYRVRMDSAVSKKTRVEVVTEGVFTRQILDDPELDDVAAVLFDEYHERSLEADLGLALALDCQQALREDLRLIPMSATLDHAGVSDLLGGAPIVSSKGRQYPVETRYLGRDGSKPLEDQMARAIRQAIAEEEGSILAFLPGQGEILRTLSKLEGRLPANVALCPLYGALGPREQDAAIKPAKDGMRKVVLATSIAQTSLTIDGVRIVIDSGLSRVSQFDPQFGLSRLVTVRCARSTADQRRGRAGRTEPGICYRLWEEAQTKALPQDEKPQILESDLSGLVLDVANWGVTDPAELSFMTPPPKAAWKEARELLISLDALNADGTLTKDGAALATLPLHPRLGHMLREAAKEGKEALAAQIAAIISEPGLGGRSPDLRDRLAGLKRDGSPRAKAAKAQAKRWRAMVGSGENIDINTEEAGDILSLAYPDRIAQQRGATGRYRLANGRGAELSSEEALSTNAFLVVAEMQGSAARSRILLAAPYSRSELEARYAAHIVEADHAIITPEGAVKATRQRRLDKLVLDEKKVAHPDPEVVTDALLELVASRGIGRLNWTKDQIRLRDRVGYLRRTDGPDWPDLSDAALSEDLSWLRPFTLGLTSLDQISAKVLGDALSTLVPWDRTTQLDELAPSHFQAPTGSRVPIDYSRPEQPMLSIRVQELFGLAEHPCVCGGKISLLLELLSPAQRPIQVTGDLPGFWQGSWADVKADMRGRYPKHHWPDNPLEAEATRRAKSRPAK